MVLRGSLVRDDTAKDLLHQSEYCDGFLIAVSSATKNNLYDIVQKMNLIIINRQNLLSIYYQLRRLLSESLDEYADEDVI